jgi:hypothetical protein
LTFRLLLEFNRALKQQAMRTLRRGVELAVLGEVSRLGVAPVSALRIHDFDVSTMRMP